MSYRTKIDLLILGIMFILSPILAHSEPINEFRHYDVRDGMSSNSVKDIIQDRKGYMWFATKDGLNRFNGRYFESFCSSAEGDGMNIDAFCQHISENKIWLACPEGLFIFDCDTETCTKRNIDNYNFTNINDICYDHNGNLWIACNDGVHRYNEKESYLRHYFICTPGRFSNGRSEEKLITAKVIAIDNYGNVLVGHAGGISKYIQDNDCFSSAYRLDANDKKSDFNAVTAMYQTDVDKFLIGTQLGTVAVFSESSNSYSIYTPGGNPKITTDRVHDFSLIEGSRYYVGTDNGMYILDIKNGEWSTCRNDLATESIYRFAKDRENGLWIGTYFRGVNYRSEIINHIDWFTDNGKRDGLKGTAVSEICDDGNGNLWIATENGGLSRFNIKEQRFTDFSKLTYNNLHALLIDRNKLWIGTFSHGIDCLDLNTMRVRNFSHDRNDSSSLCNDFIYAILKGSDNNMYIGTLEGMCVYSPKSGKFTRVKEAGNAFICDLAEDAGGNIWAAGRQSGLWMLPKDAKEWRHYESGGNGGQIPDNFITRIYNDENGRMWFCTGSKGIFRYIPETDSFTSYGTEQGLPNSIYYGILDDGTGNLWLSSSIGIVKYNLESQKSQLYTVEDGMQSNQFNYRSSLKTADGKMYFGGVSGFNSFYPTKLTSNEVAPEVNISHISVSYSGKDSRKTTEPIASGTIKLPHNAVVIDINLDCLSYAAPSRNQFSWRMEGVSSEWIITKNNTISFSNLKAGKHRFQARSCNNNGVWSQDYASLEIIIKAHPLLSWWAFIIYALLLSGIGYGVYVVIQRRRREQAEKKMIEDKIAFFNQIFQNINAPGKEVVKEMESSDKDEEKWQEKLNEIIRDNLNEGDFTTEKLADKLLMSRTSLQRKMKAMYGMTPNEYIKMVRLRAAAQLLETGRYRINEVCWMSGFNNFSYFSKVFTQYYGMRPKEYATEHAPKGMAATVGKAK